MISLIKIQDTGERTAAQSTVALKSWSASVGMASAMARSRFLASSSVAARADEFSLPYNGAGAADSSASSFCRTRGFDASSAPKAAVARPGGRRAAEARVAVDNYRYLAGRPDALPCSFLHLDSRDDARIRLAPAGTYSKSRQEQHRSAGLGEDFRRQRVVDARAHDGSGRSQHGAQLTSTADCAALCNGCKEQPHNSAVCRRLIARYECQG